MLDCWLWDVVDRGSMGLHRADPAQEAQVAAAALQASAQGEGCSVMNADTSYTVNLIQKGLTLFDKLLYQ